MKRFKTTMTAIFVALMVLAAVCIWDYLRPVMVPTIEPTVDVIVVEKAAHRMQLFSQGQLLQSFSVALGRGGPGPKTKYGDGKVPEGAYRITGRNPHSAYHLSMRISYPTKDQALAAQAQGIDPGGDVMIHGLRRGLGWLGPLRRFVDWTLGCVAVTNAEVEQVWRSVPNGTRIVIKP